MELERNILEILEKNSRIHSEDIATMLGVTREEVRSTIKKLEDEKIICGYPAVINWDKTEKEGDYVTALIEVKVTPQREQGFESIAKRIYKFDEVTNLYLMSGTFDFLIVIEGKNIREVSSFVSNKLATLDCILSSSTHFVLKKYKDHSVIIDENTPKDERIIVSP